MNIKSKAEKERIEKIALMLDKSALISIFASIFLVLKVYRGGIIMLIPVMLVVLISAKNLYRYYQKGAIKYYINRDILFLVYIVLFTVIFFIACIEMEAYPFLILYGSMLIYHIYTGFREGLDTLDEDPLKDCLKKRGIDS